MENKFFVSYNEQKEVLTITTPGGFEFILSDKDKTITLDDHSGNKIEMNSNGISLFSEKDIAMKSNGNINIQAKQNISVKATGDLNLAGLNVNANANLAFKAKGNSTAELKSSAQTSVKGAMVMIN